MSKKHEHVDMKAKVLLSGCSRIEGVCDENLLCHIRHFIYNEIVAKAGVILILEAFYCYCLFCSIVLRHKNQKLCSNAILLYAY